MCQYHRISKKMTLQFNVHKGKGTMLERKSWYSKHWQRRLLREYNSRSETSTEDLGE
jgi:hypothetical protein